MPCYEHVQRLHAPSWRDTKPLTLRECFCRDLRLECLGLLRSLVTIAKAAPAKTHVLSRSVQSILWRINESLLESHSALTTPGIQQTAVAPGSDLLTAELIGLAEDLVLHAPAPLHACLSACQPFVAGLQLPSVAPVARSLRVPVCAVLRAAD